MNINTKGTLTPLILSFDSHPITIYTKCKQGAPVHMDLVRLFLPLRTTDPPTLPSFTYGETTNPITQVEAHKPPWKIRTRWQGHHSGFLTSRKCHRYLLQQYSFIWGGEKTRLCCFHVFSHTADLYTYVYVYTYNPKSKVFG